MLITVNFSTEMRKNFPKKYLEEFITFAKKKIIEEYPETKLRISDSLADTPLSILNNNLIVGHFQILDVNVNRIEMDEKIERSRILPVLWQRYTKEFPFKLKTPDSASVHACAK